MLNAGLDFPILALTSPSVSMSTVIMLQIYVKLSTSSSWFVSMIIGDSSHICVVGYLVHDPIYAEEEEEEHTSMAQSGPSKASDWHSSSLGRCSE